MTAEEMYEANRPRFRDWGTLKDMCLETCEQYAKQERIKVIDEAIKKVRNMSVDPIFQLILYAVETELESLK